MSMKLIHTCAITIQRLKIYLYPRVINAFLTWSATFTHNPYVRKECCLEQTSGNKWASVYPRALIDHEEYRFSTPILEYRFPCIMTINRSLRRRTQSDHFWTPTSELSAGASHKGNRYKTTIVTLDRINFRSNLPEWTRISIKSKHLDKLQRDIEGNRPSRYRELPGIYIHTDRHAYKL